LQRNGCNSFFVICQPTLPSGQNDGYLLQQVLRNSFVFGRIVVMPVLSAPLLEDFAQRLLQAGGMTAEESHVVAKSLVGSNLRGYDSHGVMRIPYYVQSLADGEFASKALLEIEENGPSRIVANGNWGVGQVQAMALLEKLSEKVASAGLAIGTMHSAGHIGRLGEYCEWAAERGWVSMFMVNSHGGVVRVAPPGGTAPRLSTNPLAMGVPNGNEPLILDFSTSATAEGKVRVKKIAGEACPPGWLLDNAGQPTTDPNTLYGNPPGSIRPMGGDQAYKGFGLGLMIEIFTGALSGGVCARPVPFPKKGNCVFAMLISPESFGGQQHFVNEVHQLAEYIRSCPTVPGVNQITLPGDPERRLYAQGITNGITLEAENFKALLELAKKLNVNAPNLA
jgi:hydroxycarboxylate dehydrogenase B